MTDDDYGGRPGRDGGELLPGAGSESLGSDDGTRRQHDGGEHPREDLAERLRAVERAVTDGDAAVRDLSDAAAVQDRLDELAGELDALVERVDALDATVQSLHGYVGELEAVNERVQRRADAARAAVERLEDDRQQPPSATAPDSGRADRTPGDAGDENGDREAGRGQPAPFEASESVDAALDSGTSDDDSLLDRVRESL